MHIFLYFYDFRTNPSVSGLTGSGNQYTNSVIVKDNIINTKVGSYIYIEPEFDEYYGSISRTLYYSNNNGTSWTTVNSMNSSKEAMGVFGIQTAGIVAGGSDASGPGFTNATESWNGTSWTTLPATINTTRADIGAFGIQSAGIIAFGSPQTAATESWNGSSWTSVNSGNTARIKPASSKNGTQTAGVVAGGSNPSVTGATELWNGTSWTTQASMATARNALAGAGTQSLGLVMGGDPTNGGATTTATEAFTGPSTTLNYKTLTTS
jgi:hypothetical protein